VTLRARWETRVSRWVALRARWVTLRARWVTLRARWVTLRARWVTLRARGVTLSASLGSLQVEKLDMFRHVPGAKWCLGLFKHVVTEDGTCIHCFEVRPTPQTLASSLCASVSGWGRRLGCSTNAESSTSRKASTSETKPFVRSIVQPRTGYSSNPLVW
jgi:hypothetical protein